jgi:hypothetical protein
MQGLAKRAHINALLGDGQPVEKTVKLRLFTCMRYMHALSRNAYLTETRLMGEKKQSILPGWGPCQSSITSKNSNPLYCTYWHVRGD